MIRRYAEFDVLRVMALGMILACHFIRNVGFYNLDIPLGCIGNMVFFVLSGWLLGLAWENKGRPPYGWKFLKDRFVRLAIPLWVFSIPYMIWLKASGYDLSAKEVLLNLFLLNWFARIPGMTPYWFITAISAFYVGVMALSHIRLRKLPSVAVTAGLAFSCVLIQIAFSLCGIRYGYVLILMLCGMLAFLNADTLLSSIRMTPRFRMGAATVVLSVILFLVFWGLVRKGDIVVGTPVCYYMTIPVAFLVMMIVLKTFTGLQENVVVTFLSSISYEIYLVHAATLLWMKPVCGHVSVYASLFLLSTFGLAIFVHIVSLVGYRYFLRRAV